MTEREATIHAIEQLATEMAADGSKKAWSNSARDPALKRFAEEVHGPMLELLAKRAGYHDGACVELFRTGAPLVGKLARTGNGTPLSKPPSLTVKQLEQQRTKSNSDILKKIKDDTKMSSQLLQACLDDQAKGRMDRPRLSHEVDLEVVALSPRFAVVQGTKADGSTKVRPIDGFTKSGCNATQPLRPLRNSLTNCLTRC